jgi:hypothetical protein
MDKFGVLGGAIFSVDNETFACIRFEVAFGLQAPSVCDNLGRLYVLARRRIGVVGSCGWVLLLSQNQLSDSRGCLRSMPPHLTKIHHRYPSHQVHIYTGLSATQQSDMHWRWEPHDTQPRPASRICNSRGAKCGRRVLKFVAKLFDTRLQLRPPWLFRSFNTLTGKPFLGERSLPPGVPALQYSPQLL